MADELCVYCSCRCGVRVRCHATAPACNALGAPPVVALRGYGRALNHRGSHMLRGGHVSPGPAAVLCFFRQ